MRLRIAIALFSVTFLLSGCNSAQPVTPENDEAQSSPSLPPDALESFLDEEARDVGCSIALDFAQRQFRDADRPIALKDTSPKGTHMPDDQASNLITYVYEGDAGDPNSPENKARSEAFTTLSKESVIADCEALSALKAERGFSPNPAEEQPPITPDGLFYEYETLVLAKPLVDLESGKAIMWTAHGCGPLCGSSGIEIYIRQADGKWSRDGYLGLSIS